MSAHRDPEKVREYCMTARARGLKVIIAGAGMSAALPGVAAAHTDLPVIGVPILGKGLGGLDALLSAVQMPAGIPVACVAIDGAEKRRRARRADNQRLAPRPPPDEPMIPRYTRPEIGAVWTQQAKLETWLEVELAATDAWAEEGVVPAEVAAAARERAAFTVEAVDEREKVTDHDVAAFVDVVAASVGAEGAPLDPLRADLLRRPRHGAGAAAAGGRRDPRHRGEGLPRRAGRAGAGGARHALRRPHPRRPRRADHLRPAPGGLRLRGAPQPASASKRPSTNSRYGKLSGAVGTYASVPPAVEARVMEKLGLRMRDGRHPGDPA